MFITFNTFVDPRAARRETDRVTHNQRFPWALLAIAISMDCVAILPAALVGVLALDIGPTLGVPPTRLGLVVSAYFLAGSVTAATVGSHIDAIGPRVAALASGAATVVCLASVAIPSGSIWALGALAAAGGAAMSITMPSTNAILGGGVLTSHRIIAICAKQAAVPVALTGAAGSIGLARILGDWRPIFLLAALLGLVVLAAFALLTRGSQRAVGSERPARGAGRSAQRAIVRVGVSSMLASLLAGALTGYAAITLHDAATSRSGVAVVLTVANAAGVLTRVLSGWWAQRMGTTSLKAVSAMMIAGGAGAALMAVDSPLAVSIGCLAAFGLGWGWSALTYAVVLELNLDNPGATGAVIQAGGMAGSGAGPLLMAGLVGAFGLGVGWIAIGVAVITAGVLLWGYQPSAPG